jgi:hypothetical protein
LSNYPTTPLGAVLAHRGLTTSPKSTRRVTRSPEHVWAIVGPPSVLLSDQVHEVLGRPSDVTDSTVTAVGPGIRYRALRSEGAVYFGAVNAMAFTVDERTGLVDSLNDASLRLAKVAGDVVFAVDAVGSVRLLRGQSESRAAVTGAKGDEVLRPGDRLHVEAHH